MKVSNKWCEYIKSKGFEKRYGIYTGFECILEDKLIVGTNTHLIKKRNYRSELLTHFYTELDTYQLKNIQRRRGRKGQELHCLCTENAEDGLMQDVPMAMPLDWWDLEQFKKEFLMDEAKRLHAIPEFRIPRNEGDWFTKSGEELVSPAVLTRTYWDLFKEYDYPLTLTDIKKYGYPDKESDKYLTGLTESMEDSDDESGEDDDKDEVESVSWRNLDLVVRCCQRIRRIKLQSKRAKRGKRMMMMMTMQRPAATGAQRRYGSKMTIWRYSVLTCWQNCLCTYQVLPLTLQSGWNTEPQMGQCPIIQPVRMN
jgi:hypothetical protein